MKKAMQWIAALSCLLTILSVVVYIQTRSPAVLPLCITLGTIAYHFVMRLAVGLAFQIGMKNRADYHKSWYRQKHWRGNSMTGSASAAGKGSCRPMKAASLIPKYIPGRR